MGADRAMHVEYGQEDYSDLGPLAVANMLAKIIQKEDVNLVILGKQVWLGWGGRERERRGGGGAGERCAMLGNVNLCMVMMCVAW